MTGASFRLTRQRAGGGAASGLDAIGRVDHALAQAGLFSPVERRYGWDRAFAPVSIADRRWGDLGYSYDENGQIAETRFGAGAGERFRYDAALNTAGFGEGVSEHGRGPGVTPGAAGSGYRDPAMGRIEGWQLSAGGRVKDATGPNGERIHLSHDVRGRVTERRVERKGFRPKTWRYEWDVKDRLVRCITPEGTAWRYGYDPFGRRVWKVRELSTAEARLYANRFPNLIDASRLPRNYADELMPVPSEIRGGLGGSTGVDNKSRPPIVGVHYLWDGDILAEEAPLRLDGSVDWEDATRWHYEPGTFRPLAKETPDGKLHYIVTDHLGTPREMFEESGKLAWAAEYRTWGEVRRLWVAEPDNDNAPRRRRGGPGGGGRAGSENGVYAERPGGSFTGGRSFGNLALKDEPAALEARLLCPIRFQGQWEDEESGLYYNRFRYYDPLAGQYISPDPIRIYGGIRLAGYVAKPTTGVDVFGLCDKDFQKMYSALTGFSGSGSVKTVALAPDGTMGFGVSGGLVEDPTVGTAYGDKPTAVGRDGEPYRPGTFKCCGEAHAAEDLLRKGAASLEGVKYLSMWNRGKNNGQLVEGYPHCQVMFGNTNSVDVFRCE